MAFRRRYNSRYRSRYSFGRRRYGGYRSRYGRGRRTIGRSRYYVMGRRRF